MGRRKRTREEFIRQAERIHGFKYLYELVGDDVRNISKVKIICPDHGVFDQTIAGHLKHGCHVCYLNSRSRTRDNFIKHSNVVHHNKYNYSLVGGDYVTCRSFVKIICPEHGVFEQLVEDHTCKYHGCPICAGQNQTIAYINNVENGFCLKYGITNHVERRLRQQAIHVNLSNLGSWLFPTPEQCKAAERELKQTLTPVMTKQMMQDGYTETCIPHYYDKIVKTYEKYGGVKQQ